VKEIKAIGKVKITAIGKDDVIVDVRGVPVGEADETDGGGSDD